SNSGRSPVTGYNVYRRDPSGLVRRLATAVTLLSYPDTSVTAGQTYSYWVTALNSYGEGVAFERALGDGSRSGSARPAHAYRDRSQDRPPHHRLDRSFGHRRFCHRGLPHLPPHGARERDAPHVRRRQGQVLQRHERCRRDDVLLSGGGGELVRRGSAVERAQCHCPTPALRPVPGDLRVVVAH